MLMFSLLNVCLNKDDIQWALRKKRCASKELRSNQMDKIGQNTNMCESILNSAVCAKCILFMWLSRL